MADKWKTEKRTMEDDDGMIAATEFVEHWAEAQLKDWHGRLKMHPAKHAKGLSQKVLKGAYLTMLHPALSLVRIAEMLETNDVNLRVWRTQDLFKEASKTAETDLTKIIRDALDTYLSDPERKRGEIHQGTVKYKPLGELVDEYVKILPFLCHAVLDQIVGFLQSRVEEKNEEALFVLLRLIHSLLTDRIRGLADLKRRPEVVEWIKFVMVQTHNFLLKPKGWKVFGERSKEEYANLLERIIAEQLDFLSDVSKENSD